jgi:hypothetical protein
VEEAVLQGAQKASAESASKEEMKDSEAYALATVVWRWCRQTTARMGQDGGWEAKCRLLHSWRAKLLHFSMYMIPL